MSASLTLAEKKVEVESLSMDFKTNNKYTLKFKFKQIHLKV